MKFLVFLTAFIVCSFANALPPLADVQYRLNQGIMAPKDQIGTQVVLHKIQTLRCVYSYARQGGAVSTISLQTVDGAACSIPNKAIVLRSMIDIVTAVSYASNASVATIALSTGKAAGDLRAAANVAGFSATGFLTTKFDWTAASAVKMTAAVTPTVVIGSSVLLAGKFNVFIDYVISD